MDKKLKVSEIAARTGLSVSTVSRVLAGKANTSARARQRVLDCARELGVMEGIAAGECCSIIWWSLPLSALSMNARIFTTIG